MLNLEAQDMLTRKSVLIDRRHWLMNRDVTKEKHLEPILTCCGDDSFKPEIQCLNDILEKMSWRCWNRKKVLRKVSKGSFRPHTAYTVPRPCILDWQQLLPHAHPKQLLPHAHTKLWSLF